MFCYRLSCLYGGGPLCCYTQRDSLPLHILVHLALFDFDLVCEPYDKSICLILPLKGRFEAAQRGPPASLGSFLFLNRIIPHTRSPPLLSFRSSAIPQSKRRRVNDGFIGNDNIFNRRWEADLC